MDSLCRFSFLTDEQAAPTEVKGLSLLDDADRDPIVEAVDYAAAQVGAANPSGQGDLRCRPTRFEHQREIARAGSARAQVVSPEREDYLRTRIAYRLGFRAVPVCTCEIDFYERLARCGN